MRACVCACVRACILSYVYTSFTIYLLYSFYGYQNLCSPLHLAAKHDRIEVVEILGKAGSDVNIVNKVRAVPKVYSYIITYVCIYLSIYITLL